jgi:hypothetical protein
LEQTIIETKELYPCPCCGQKTLSEIGCWEIRVVCGWEDDPIQSKYPHLSTGANKISLNKAIKKYNQYRADNS